LELKDEAVSKWENGSSDTNTSNLIALAKLYGVSAEELLKEIKDNSNTEGKDINSESKCWVG
jgi:transcriptional regulator with XRE-family HTH domain